MKKDKKNKSVKKSGKKSIIKTILSFILDILYNFTVILIVVIIVRTFIVSPFNVKGGSMLSTLENEDLIVIDKISMRFDAPDFGDIVVFTPPTPRRSTDVSFLQCMFIKISTLSLKEDACDIPQIFIKRIIGVSGDVIEIKDGEVYRNDEILDEEYLDEYNKHKTLIPDKKQYAKYEIPEDSYFVMGDNRTGSSDSRSHQKEWTDSETGDHHPFVAIEDVQGKYLFVLLPAKIKLFLRAVVGKAMFWI